LEALLQSAKDLCRITKREKIYKNLRLLVLKIRELLNTRKSKKVVVKVSVKEHSLDLIQIKARHHLNLKKERLKSFNNQYKKSQRL